MAKEEKDYRTQQIIVKKGHRLYSYFQQNTENAKNLYNSTNFYIRQVYTALTSSEEVLNPLQQEVLSTIEQNISHMNEVQQAAYAKAVERENKKEKSKRKKVKLNLFEKPSSENPYINYSFLDALFKCIKQSDYLSLPIQSSQATMKKVFSDWKSFFANLKNYRLHPEKYKGRPRIPGYIRCAQKEIEFTNQDCVIKEKKYLKFPKTKLMLNIGKIGKVSSKPKSIRVIPRYDYFVVELVFEYNDYHKQEEKVSNRFLSIDLGVNNFATITTNTGIEPILLKGGNIKSINQYYNKQRAHYVSVLRQGKGSKEGKFTSKRLIKLDDIRHRKLKDIFHKASFFICELAAFEQIDTIIIGQNKDWKQNSDLGKKNNQRFVQIPYSLLVNMIAYKAKELGIKVVSIEESYTSKASFLDNDKIPVYGDSEEKRFTGKRIKRGAYRSGDGRLINADVNGSANIMRKYAIKKGIQLHIEDVCVESPLTYKIA